MGRDTIQLEDALSTISQEYLLNFTSEYGISEDLHPELPVLEETIVGFPEGKVGVYTKFFEFANYRIPLSQFLFDILGHYQIHLSQLSMIGAVKVDEAVFPTTVVWHTNAPKDEMPSANAYAAADVAVLNTHQMDLFNLICALNPTKVKTGTRPSLAHEVPLLTLTAGRMIDMDVSVRTSESAGTASTMEKSPLDFDNENPSPRITEGDEIEEQVQDEVAQEIPSVGNPPATEVVPEPDLEEEEATIGSLVKKRRKQMRHKRANEEAEENAPTKVLRKDHVSSPAHSTHEGKSLAAMGLGAGSISPMPNTVAILTNHIVLCRECMSSKKAPFAEDSDSEKSTSFTSMSGSPGNIYQPGWGVTNSCRLDTPDVCQDMVDHIVPPGYFSELRHLPNDEFLNQYNVNLVRQVAMGSQLRLRFKQEVRLLKKAKAQIARRDQRIQAREEEITKLDQEVHGLRGQTKNLETLLEAEEGMRKTAEAKNTELMREIESLHGKFLGMQVNNQQLTQQVSVLQAQVTGEEKIKAAFEEFKKYEDDRVNSRCAEMDARLDALSIDFDEELYPHMLTVNAGCQWVIRHGLRLAVIKCVESTKLRRAFADVVSAGVAKEADAKYIAALHALKELKYPLVDELEKLKDAPIDVRDPKNPWAFKEELLLKDAIAVNKIRTEKKKGCRMVCRTHGVGSAYHARSDGIPVFVPTVVPQDLAILLADAATQTDISEDEASPRLLSVLHAPWESCRIYLTS
ncbi:hypothetical protein Tco_0696147 [Tanacetum coccineum]